MLDLNIVRKRFPEVRVTYGGSGVEYNVNCPFPHAKGGTGKMDIHAETSAFYCHDCGAAGNAERDFLAGYLDPFPGLRIDREPDELRTQLPSRQVNVRHGGPTLENNVPSPGQIIGLSTLDDDHPACQYLADRGLPLQEIKSLTDAREVKYCTGPLDGKGRKDVYGRLVFPVYSGGVLRAWQARKIDRVVDADTRETWDGKKWTTARRLPDRTWSDKHEQKYLFNYGIQKTQILYGLDWSRQASQCAVVVEGVMDCLQVGPEAVATFGLVSHAQKRILTATFDAVVLVLDPDIREDHPDPRVQAKFRDTVSGWAPLSVTWLHLPGGKDPADTPRPKIWQAIRDAQGVRPPPPQTVYQN